MDPPNQMLKDMKVQAEYKLFTEVLSNRLVSFAEKIVGEC